MLIGQALFRAILDDVAKQKWVNSVVEKTHK
jgi:hypothetical protein